MKVSAVICVVLSIAAGSFAAKTLGTFKNAAYPDKCYMNANLILSTGEEAKNPNVPCGGIVCQKDGVASLETCSPLHIDGYEQGDYVDALAPYPKCCERKLIKVPQ